MKKAIIFCCISFFCEISIGFAALDYLKNFSSESNQENNIINLTEGDFLIKQIRLLSENYPNHPDTMSFLYDDKGNIVFEKFVNRHSSGGSDVSYYKTAYFYSFNDFDKVLSTNCQYFSEGEWKNDYRITYFYDTKERIISELKDTWQDEVWNNYSLIEYSYNSKDNLESDVVMKWSADSWIFDFQRTYLYDSLGNLSSFLREVRKNDKWNNNYRTSYIYDIRKNLLSSFGEVWDDSLWQPSYFLKYSYDDSNNTRIRAEKRWILAKLMYVDSISYKYDSLNNVIEEIKNTVMDSIYHYEGKFSDYYEYLYGNDGNILSYKTDKYNELGLSQQLLDTIIYNENGSVLAGKFFAWNGFDWLKTDKIKLSLNLRDSFRERNYTASHCREFVVDYFIGTNIEDSKKDKLLSVEIYPNLASEYLYIDVNKNFQYEPTIEIKNILGQTLISEIFNFESIADNLFYININMLPQGIYYVEIKSGLSTITEKFLIVR